MELLRIILTICAFCTTCSGMIENLYCGTEICYEVLGVDRDATKSEITKAYRGLARKWHPDMHKKKEDKEAASEMFTKIANAYEILKEEESRKDYDYYLDHPEEYYSHYYRYYRRRMAPKVDVRIVIAVTISIISGIQYWSAWNNYNVALKHLVTIPKYRLQATDIAKQEGLLGNKRKKDRSKTKDELREEEEEILRNVIAERMDIRGGYSKPSVYDILWLQLLFSPYHLARYIHWWLRWIWCFWICKHEYGPEEKAYIIRRFMKVSQGQWDAFDDREKQGYMDKELWKKNNFQVWKAEKEEEMKADLATNNRYKMYRRYMKKGGPGQMTFGPE